MRYARPSRIFDNPTQHIRCVAPVDSRCSANSTDLRIVYAALLETSPNATQCLRQQFAHAIEFVEVAGLLVAVSDKPKPKYDMDVTAEQLNDFADVVNQLHQVVDILPFRFGSGMSLQQLAATLEPVASKHCECLTRIAGCSEINIRWAIPIDPSSHSHSTEKKPVTKIVSGTDYLQSKRNSNRLASGVESSVEGIAIQLKKLFENHCTAIRTSVRSMQLRSPASGSDLAYSVAQVDLLVRREAVRNAMKAASMMPLHEALPNVVSGPWPPYSFVGASQG